MSNSILYLMFGKVLHSGSRDIINSYYGSRYLFEPLLCCSTFHHFILILLQLSLLMRFEHAIRIKLCNLILDLLHLIFALGPLFLKHNLKRSQRPLNCYKWFSHWINKLNWNSIVKHFTCILSLIRIGKFYKGKSFAHFAFMILWYAYMLDVPCSLKDLS